MSMQFKKRNAFTITELIIVIVVIAVISAAVITIYFTVVENAKRSKDIQTARQMQNAVIIGMPSENADVFEIVRILFKSGFDPDDLFASAEDNVFAWCRSEGTIVLYTEAGDVLFPAYLDGRYSRDEMSSVFIPLYTALSVVEVEEDAPSEESSSKETVEPFAETEEESSSAEESTTEEKTEPLPETTEETTTVAPETTEEETTTVAPETTEEETTTVAPETTEPADDKVILIRSDDEFQQAIENASEGAILKLDCDIHSIGFNVRKSIIIDLNQNTLYLDLAWVSISVYSGVVLEIRNGAIVATGFSEEIYAAIYLLKNAEVQFVSVRMTAEYLNVFDMSDDSILVLENSYIYADGIVVNSNRSDTFVNISDAKLHSGNTAIYLNNVKKFFAEICDIYAPLAIDAGGGSVELRNTNAYLEDESGGVMRFGGGTKLEVFMQTTSVSKIELTEPAEDVLYLFSDNDSVKNFCYITNGASEGKIYINGYDVYELEI